MTKAGEAIVLGASMAGMFAARVLSDFYEKVTVLDRDELADAPTSRRGVPQGKHPHMLQPRGAQIAEELFPGFLDELVANGAPVWNDGDVSKLYISVNGHLLLRSGIYRDPAAVTAYLPSRPLLESLLRRRLRKTRNVTLLDRHEVVETTATATNDRVTGVRVVKRHADNQEVTMSADLVVDATGRGSRAPSLLARLGYGEPIEDEVVVNLTYASQLLRIPPDQLREHIVAIFPAPGRPTMIVLCRQENGTSMLCIGGMMGVSPPMDRAGMLDFVESIVPPHTMAALRAAEPLSESARYKVPSSRWRRFDKMPRIPKGFIPIGDAICSFNPIYGQGMTVAALEALALRDCLQGVRDDLPRRFARAAAKVVGIAWQMSAGSDLALPEVPGPRPSTFRLTNFYTSRILSVIGSDPFVAERYARVAGFVDSPNRLLDPRVVWHVATSARRQRRRAPA
jgi:2-polyprenyl-6-methoxyphenol hydroxylase-like FAD-dependent oxidoreductase